MSPKYIIEIFNKGYKIKNWIVTRLSARPEINLWKVKKTLNYRFERIYYFSEIFFLDR